jgi:hypothetical protein
MGSNSHDTLGSRQLQGLWSARAIADEPYEGITHVRVRGGRGEQSRPLPGSGRAEACQVAKVASDAARH